MSLLSLLRGGDNSEVRQSSDWAEPWHQSQAGLVNTVSAFNLSAVWACETLIADAIATMPVDTYRAGADIAEETTPPPWIAAPNPQSTKVDYDTERIISLLGWGNSYSLLVRRGGSADPMVPVLERWMINPARVSIPQGKAMRPTYLIDGVEVPSTNIQHITGYRRPGDVKGMSVIENATAGLSASVAAEELAKNIYENGLNTSGVVSIPAMDAEVSDEVIKRVAAKIREWYGGSKNAGKPLVLTGGTTWTPMSVTPSDAQFLETRQFQIEEIARWFRVPPHMIGQLDKQSSWGTGIEQQALAFVRYTLQPWIVRLEQADTALLRDEYVKYNVDSLVRADLKTRYEAHKLAIDSGMASPNRRLVLEDEPPIVGGDAVRLPAGVSLVSPTTPLDATDATIVGGLVRAGFEPAEVLAALGLPPIKHTGNLPVTVQAEPSQEVTDGSE